MGRGKLGIIRLWSLVIFTLLVYATPQTVSSKEDESKTCKPSHCGIITNISYPFRLRDDPPNCGLRPFELACENNVPFLHLYPSASNLKYQVLRINYNNYTIRLKDPGIRGGDFSSLPRYSLSSSNFSDTYNDSYEYDRNNPYAVSLDQGTTIHHVIYLKCRDPVRDDARYVEWGSKEGGGGGGHFYVVVGEDLEVERLKPKCGVILVATIDSHWRSFLKGENYSYSDVHRILSRGFDISWWPQACSGFRCARNEKCIFHSETQLVHCSSKDKPSCYSISGVAFPLFCGKTADLSYRAEAYLLGILAGFPSSTGMHHFVELVYLFVNDSGADMYRDDLISTQVAFTLGKITAYVSAAFIVRFQVGTVFLFILLIYTCRRRHLSVYESIEDFIRLHNLHPIRYSYQDLKRMTKGFKNKIGEGGFGTVYKGKLRSGHEIAIKMLGNKSKGTCQDFINEVATIGRIHHFNVVRLIGFCVEGRKHALIYEFMSNGSLDKHIFLKEGHASLSYRRIYDISLGVARGIAYLHHGCDMQILHFDIKPHNILLDGNFTPKISDFGLARSYTTDDSIATLTVARGTLGYMAPELFYKNIGKVSHKSDVYSFGKLLMEMTSRRKNMDPNIEHSSQVYFPSWIYDQFDEEKYLEIDLTENEGVLAKKMFIVALWCIQFNPVDRPSMNKVIEMLEVDDVGSLEMPPKPSIYPEDHQNTSDETTYSFPSSYLGNIDAGDTE